MAAPQPQHSITGAEAPGGHGAVFLPFQSETFVSQLLWLAIAFGLLYYLMSRVALPRIGRILHERSERLARDLDEAHRLKSDADAAGAAYEASLREARANAERIAQETRNALAAESEGRRKALEAELKAKLAAAEASIAARRVEAMGNVRAIAADAATTIVERLIGQRPEPAVIEGALDRTLTRS